MSAYQNTDYGPALLRFREYFLAKGKKGLPAERVGEVVLKALTARKPRVRYAVVPRPCRTGPCPGSCPSAGSMVSLAGSSAYVARTKRS